MVFSYIHCTSGPPIGESSVGSTIMMYGLKEIPVACTVILITSSASSAKYCVWLKLTHTTIQRNNLMLVHKVYHMLTVSIFNLSYSYTGVI